MSGRPPHPQRTCARAYRPLPPTAPPGLALESRVTVACSATPRVPSPAPGASSPASDLSVDGAQLQVDRPSRCVLPPMRGRGPRAATALNARQLTRLWPRRCSRPDSAGPNGAPGEAEARYNPSYVAAQLEQLRMVRRQNTRLREAAQEKDDTISQLERDLQRAKQESRKVPRPPRPAAAARALTATAQHLSLTADGRGRCAEEGERAGWPAGGGGPRGEGEGVAEAGGGGGRSEGGDAPERGARPAAPRGRGQVPGPGAVPGRELGAEQVRVHRAGPRGEAERGGAGAAERVQPPAPRVRQPRARAARAGAAHGGAGAGAGRHHPGP